jgi:small subunit ribosomal protein S2
MINTKKTNIVTINQLLNSYVHIGNKVSKWNPLIKNFLFGIRHGVHFFDLKKIMPYIKRTLFFLSMATKNHQIIFFVGSHPLVTVLIKFISINTKQPSISRKWVGGTLTNWLKIKPYVKFLYNTNIEKIKKKFVLRTEKKIEQKIVQYLKMKYLLSGIERMPSIPNIVIILEKETDSYPLLEAFKLMLPIVSIINSNSSGLGISYPLIGNDYIFDSLFFYSSLILQSIKTGFDLKRLSFLNLTLPFIIKLKEKSKKNKLLKKTNFNKYLYKKFFIFFRNYRTYQSLAIKRLLRKYCYILNLRKKEKINF